MKKNVLVFGSIIFDIVATFKEKDEDLKSKIGSINYSIGGVGYNIATNLDQKGFKVSFFSCLKKDSITTDLVKKILHQTNIDYSEIIESEKIGEIGYVAQNKGANLDSGITSAQIELVDLKKKERIIEKYVENTELVVIDTNLNKEQIKFIVDISKRHKKDIFISVVSDAKSNKIFQEKFSCEFVLVCLNNEEAKTLRIDIDSVKSENEIEKLCSDFNCQYLIATQGEDGYCIFNKEKKTKKIVPYASYNNIKNTSGCGDALFSAVCAGYLENGGVDSDKTKMKINEWVDNVIKIEAPNMGPQNFNNIKEQRENTKTFWTLLFFIISMISLIWGAFCVVSNLTFFIVLLFICAISTGSVGSLIRDVILNIINEAPRSKVTLPNSIVIGMVAGALSSILAIFPNISIKPIQQNNISEFKILVIVVFITSLVTGVAIDAFFEKVIKGKIVDNTINK
jgi:pseudouridine kinase